jgi:DNA topoisomerase-3
MTIVVIAEKPTVGRAIAKLLGATTNKGDYMEGGDYQVTWAYGHLADLKEPEDYSPDLKKWAWATLPMTPVFALKAKDDDGAKKQLRLIKELVKGSTGIVCATDAGREGELIYRYIADFLGFGNKPFKRLWISSLTDEAIRSGFAQLRNGSDFDNLFKAAQCRSQADWLIGMNGTRLYSIKAGNGNGVLSIGRVQTPVLALIAQRDNEIEKFVPKNFWELHSFYKGADFLYTGGRFDEENKAKAVCSKITGATLVITDVSGKPEKVLPLLLHDLTDLQKEMSNVHGLTADETLKTLQALYEKKHVTYPRTDSRYLSEDMRAEMPQLIKTLCSLFQDKAGLLPNGAEMPSRYFNNDKVTDHHAIIPTNSLPTGLTDSEHKVYEAIATRFIAAFLPPQIKRVTTVLATVGGEKFKASGTVIEVMGWKALYADSDNETRLPFFENGESGSQEPKITHGKTTPPKRYTEATLLAMMETAGRVCESEEQRDIMKDKGLGTPATRAETIVTLLKRGFIERYKKEVRSTENGRRLIEIIQTKELKSPELTGELEIKLKLIEQGKYSPESFMSEVVQYAHKMKADLESSTVAPVIKDAIADCPVCKKGKVVESTKSFSCSGWREGCKFSIWKEIAGKEITLPMVEQILTTGQTGLINGFKSKAKNEFSAFLKLQDGKVDFVFPPR